MLDFVLVGCGRIAMRHAQLLGTGQIDGARLGGVCDIVESKAKALGEKYNSPWFTDIDRMLETVKAEVAVVLTESGNHARHALQIAEHDVHIVVEKPMALTLQDADAMIEKCDKRNLKLFVVKQNRFNLPVRKLREAVEAGRFGKHVMGTVRVRWCRDQAYYDQDAWRGTWALDGGVLTNQASHHVDLLEWMMGSVDSVVAMSTRALAQIEAEDTATVLLRFSSGALGIIEATTAARPKDLEGSISILGEKGTVEIGGFAVNELKVWSFMERQAGDEDVVKKFSVNPPNVYGFGHKEYYQHVVKAIRGDGANLVDGLQGRRSLELINAIYESIESRREVSLRFQPHHVKLGHPARTSV